jgi:retron-type reverse transcriptase
MAYEPGVGIKLNATHHKDSCFLLKMDFKDFFPSITPYLFFSITEKLGFKFDDINRRLIENIIFWKSTRDSNLKLSIGAPTSPFISNFVLYEFDRHMAEFCLLRKIIYTRYADDLTFTCNEKGTLFEIPSIVEKQLKHHCFGKIKINKKKTVFSSKAFNRHVTGIVITNDNQLSIGRDRKRELSSMIHKFSLGKLDETESSRLKGLLSYAHHIEPIFINRMKRKYGPDIVNQIFSYICS